MAINIGVEKVALLIIDGVPFTIPNAQRCVTESSNTNVDYERASVLFGRSQTLDKDGNVVKKNSEKSTTTPTYYYVMDKNLSVSIEISTGDEFFNKYNILKTAIDGLIYLTESNPYNKFTNYVSYWGLRDYMEYGQFSSVSFTNNSSTNMATINLQMQSYNKQFQDLAGV